MCLQIGHQPYLYVIIFGLFKNVVLHKSQLNIIYILPYNAKLNPIENLFSQIKNYVKNISPATYEDLKITIDKIIKNKIKKEHLKNYFKYLFIQAKEYIDTHK